MNYIGEDQVIAVRDRSGTVQVLLNSCSHRGNTVCRAEQGRTNSFLCSYHGWN
jgi:3-phenylpropionate/trans-cinnamate dioxygenase alpha subunit